MHDDTNVHPKVHLNVHLRDEPDNRFPSGKNDRGTSPRASTRKGPKKPFLHQRDGYWFFQRRWPKSLDPTGSAAPLRIALGRISEPQARRAAQALALRTGAYFESLISCNISQSSSSRSDAMQPDSISASEGSSPDRRAGRVVHVAIQGKLPRSGASSDTDQQLTLDGIRASMRVLKDISAARQGSAIESTGLKLIDGIWEAHAHASAVRTAAALDFKRFAAELDSAEIKPRALFASPVQDPSIAPAALFASATSDRLQIPAVAAIEASPAAVRLAGQPVASDHDALLQHHRASLDSAQPTVSTTSPAPIASANFIGSDHGIYEPSVELIERWKSSDDLDQQLTAKTLFSDCVASYVARRKANNPTVQVSSAIYPARLWIALIGDRPMDAYDPLDLQRFVDRAKHVPPNFEKRFPGKSVAGIVAENQEFRLGVPKRKTVGDTWVATLKGVFSFHAKRARTRSPLGGVTVDLPRMLAKPKKHPAPPIVVTNAAFKIGAGSDNEVDALLPLIAYATGRRIGLLAYLQGASFRIDQRTGVAFALVAQTIQTQNGLELTPYKTDESAGEFVIPKYVVDTGFVAWAMAKGTDFVFSSAQRAKDPADTVSKRVNALLALARDETSERSKGTAHGWRGQAEDRFGEQSIPDGASRIQVGHAPSDEHERYKSGRLPTPDAQRIYEAGPDDGIDLSPFENLDFSRFDQAGE
jgi:integrase